MNSTVSTVTSKGQVTIPKAIRDRLHLLSGDKVEFLFNEHDEVVIKPVTRTAREVAGMLNRYTKPTPVTVEEMNRSIKRYVVEKFK